MKVWIVNPYGNLPGEGWRDYRSTMLAHALEKAGHEAIWWVANFEHRTKQFRTTGFEVRDVSSKFKVHLVPSTAYSHNISLARIRFEKRFARNFVQLSQAYPSPDVLVIADPALFTSTDVVAYAKSTGCKLVVDILDLWPELFHLVLPRPLSWLGNMLFAPLYRKRSWLLRQADGIVAVSKNYLDLASNAAPETPGNVFYLGINLDDFYKSLRNSNALVNVELPIKAPEHSWVIYAGTLGINYDIKTLIEAARILKKTQCHVQLLVVGEGPLRTMITNVIRGEKLDNITYLGILPVDQLNALYKYCDIALSTYRGLSTVSMPVKAFDCLAAGLPVVNSLDKDWGELVADKQLGVQYAAGDADSLAQAIKLLHLNKELSQNMRNNLLMCAHTFDTGTIYPNYVIFIENIVNNKV